jgi:hypothetical protein
MPQPTIAAGAPALWQRRGALLRTELTSTSLDELARSLTASLAGWARDAELYAVVIDACMCTAAATASDRPAFEAAVFRLDCFSKPTVTLLGADPSPDVLAIGLAGTHRVLDPDGRIDWIGGRDIARLPTIVLRQAGRSPDLPPVLSAAAALDRGFATHCLTPADIVAVVDGLTDAEPVDPLLDDRQRRPPPVTAIGALPPAPVQAAAAAAAASDLHAATLARAAPGSSLPTRAELQSLRGR